VIAQCNSATLAARLAHPGHSPAGSPIWVAGGRDGHQAVLTVRDRGPGIPPADRGRVFQRYTRLDRQTNPTGGGLGLGLYVARQLASANHSELQVTDPPSGRGAQLELRLPLAWPAPDLRRGEQPPPTPARHDP
jgi:signal transduction histidine kinase